MNHLALVAYESRYARCGGVTAVLNYLPGALAKAIGAVTYVISPYHHRIRETTKLAPQTVGTLAVPFAGQNVVVRIRRHDDRWPWIFVDAQDFVLPASCRQEGTDTHFFSGRRHPYDVGRAAGDQLAILRRDALFFGAAVARALPLLNADTDWTLLLQDWQAATAALALAGAPRSARCFLTLHNSYDSGGVWPDELERAGIHAAAVPGADDSEAATVLNRAFPLLGKPIFTVSQQFALDFTEDVFQREVMANQLQHALQPPHILGINNGPFASLAIPADAVAAAQRGDHTALRAWKSGQKEKAIAALDAFAPTPDRPAWGDRTQFVRLAKERDPAWFVLAGRDDARQKGYDIAAAAVRQLLGQPGRADAAQFIFFPIPGDEDRAGLAFLRDLAEAFAANVLVLPFIFVEGYVAALQGAAFGVMPSLYEPFGMANEFYLNGAVGIGRATGGLLQQIVPLRSAPSFTPAVARRAERWHAPDAAATGFLYREPDDLPNVIGDWRGLNGVGYVVGGHPDRVEERSRFGLFNAMAEGLRQALADALDRYGKTAGHDEYFALLANGVAHVQRTLSWDASAAEYARYLQ
jgi:glycogen synthase